MLQNQKQSNELNHRQKNKVIHEIKKADKIEKAHEWQQIIEDLPEKELRSFIKNCAIKDEELQNELIITYAKPSEIDNTNKYKLKKMTYDLSI